MRRLQLDAGSASEYADHEVRSATMEIWVVLALIVAVLGVVSWQAKASFVNQRTEAIRILGDAQTNSIETGDKQRLQQITDLLVSKDDFEYAAFLEPKGQILARSIRDNVSSPAIVLSVEPTRSVNLLTGKWLFTVPIFNDMGYKRVPVGYVSCQATSLEYLWFILFLVALVTVLGFCFSLRLRMTAATIGKMQRRRWDSVSTILESNLNGEHEQIQFSDGDPAELAKLKAFCNEFIRRLHSQG